MYFCLVITIAIFVVDNAAIFLLSKGTTNTIVYTPHNWSSSVSHGERERERRERERERERDRKREKEREINREKESKRE